MRLLNRTNGYPIRTQLAGFICRIHRKKSNDTLDGTLAFQWAGIAPSGENPSPTGAPVELETN